MKTIKILCQETILLCLWDNICPNLEGVNMVKTDLPCIFTPQITTERVAFPLHNCMTSHLVYHCKNWLVINYCVKCWPPGEERCLTTLKMAARETSCRAEESFCSSLIVADRQTCNSYGQVDKSQYIFFVCLFICLLFGWRKNLSWWGESVTFYLSCSLGKLV